MKIIKDVNLLPEYVYIKHERAKKRAIIFFGVVMFILVMVGLYLAPKFIYKNYEEEKQIIKLEIEALSDVQAKIDKLEEIESRKSRKKGALAKVKNEQENYLKKF